MEGGRERRSGEGEVSTEWTGREARGKVDVRGRGRGGEEGEGDSSVGAGDWEG